MNTKEIVIILIISILTILLAGVVIASDLGNSGGADPERGIEIESIEFNIPAGYEKTILKLL